MSETKHDEIAVTVRQWAENHSAPDEILMESTNGTTLTPRQIADEVEKGSPIGEEFKQAAAELLKRNHN